jgi:hypothetical protein
MPVANFFHSRIRGLLICALILCTSCKPKEDDYEALLNDNVIGGPTAPSLLPTPSVPDGGNSWDFITSTNYIFDPKYVEVADGVARLIPLDLNHDSSAEFDAGTFNGAIYVGGELTLGNLGGCDSTDTNCSALNSDWTPRWNNIVGYWKMDNDWLDSVGSNNGTPSGAAAHTTDTKIGSHAGDFEGTTSFVTVGQYQSSDLSFASWFYVRSIATAQPLAFRVNNDNLYPRFFVDTLGALRCQYRSNATTRNLSSPLGVVQVNRWYHMAASYSEATGFKIFLNGTLVAFDSTPGVLETGEAFQMLLGRDSNLNLYLDGRLDEVALWNTKIADEDVAKIYHRQKAKFQGEYFSPIIDLGAPGVWSNIDWVTSLPFGKELTGDSGGELLVDYSGLVDQTGLPGDSDLNTGLVGLWHLNETQFTMGAGNDFADSSIYDQKGEIQAESLFGQEGILGTSVYMDGVDDGITFGDAPQFDFPAGQNYSYSIWFRTDDTSAGTRYLVSKKLTLFTPGYLLAVSGGFAFSVIGVGAPGFNVSTTSIIDGKWHLITVTNDRAGFMRLYVDGKEDAAPVDLTPLVGSLENAEPLLLGNNGAPGGYNQGYFDEFAMWNRVLDPAEVLELYRRGANRAKFQVRSCNDSSCTGESWVGPDGTDSSYFSELNNCTSIDSVSGVCDGSVRPNYPSVDFSSQPNAPAMNQYFQYRVFMESDDEIGVCAGSTTCVPSIKNIQAGPTGRYYGGSPSVLNRYPISFSSLSSFHQSSSGGCNPTFQISNNGAVFYYWDGSSWEVATNSTESNYATTISANIGSFVSEIDSGFFYWRVYLFSNTSIGCELDQVKFF